MAKSCHRSLIRRGRMSSMRRLEGTRSNGRYLPGVKLPDNINAIPDIETVAKDADILIFNFPHQVQSLLTVLTKVCCQDLCAAQRPHQSARPRNFMYQRSRCQGRLNHVISLLHNTTSRHILWCPLRSQHCRRNRE